MMINKRIGVQLTALAAFITAIGIWSARPAYPSSTELLQFLPDGTGVVVVDFDKVTASTLWSSSQKGIRDTLEKFQPGISDLVNPEDIRAVAVALEGLELKNVTGVVTGSFNQSEVLGRLKSNSRINLTSEKYKNLDLYHVGSSNASAKRDLAFAFYEAGTLIVGTPSGVRAAIDTKVTGKNSIAQNSKLTAALAEVQPAAVRFALTNTPAMTSGLQSGELPVPDFSTISLIFGTIDLGSGMDFNATLRSDTGEHAKSIAERLNALLSMAKGFLGGAGDPKFAPFLEVLKTVNISSAEADVKVTGNLPMEVLSTLLGGNRKS